MRKLLSFLNLLEQSCIHYKLNKIRDSILVEVSVPGQRWEIEFFANNQVEVERFISTGEIENETALDYLFQNFSDQ